MPVTTDLKRDAWAAESDLPLVLIEIDHADLTQPIRVVNDREDVISNGVTYTAFPFGISLPDDLEDAPPRARLQISNVSQEIGQAVRTISTAASVTIKVIRRDTPDIVEMDFPGLRLVNIRMDALSVEGDLEFEDLTREPFPAHIFSPAEFPGLVK